MCADQFEALQEELYQRRDECVQLRAMLASHDNQSSQNVANPLNGNEDVDVNELKMAYNSQRELKRLLCLTVVFSRTVHLALHTYIRTYIHKSFLYSTYKFDRVAMHLTTCHFC